MNEVLFDLAFGDLQNPQGISGYAKFDDLDNLASKMFRADEPVVGMRFQYRKQLGFPLRKLCISAPIIALDYCKPEGLTTDE